MLNVTKPRERGDAGKPPAGPAVLFSGIVGIFKTLSVKSAVRSMRWVAAGRSGPRAWKAP